MGFWSLECRTQSIHIFNDFINTPNRNNTDFRLWWSNIEWYVWIEVNQWYSNFRRWGMEKRSKWKQKYCRMGLWNQQASDSNLLFQGTFSNIRTRLEFILSNRNLGMGLYLIILKGNQSYCFCSKYCDTNYCHYSNHFAAAISPSW